MTGGAWWSPDRSAACGKTLKYRVPYRSRIRTGGVDCMTGPTDARGPPALAPEVLAVPSAGWPA